MVVADEEVDSWTHEDSDLNEECFVAVKYEIRFEGDDLTRAPVLP